MPELTKSLKSLKDSLVTPWPAKDLRELLRVLLIRILYRYVFTYAMLATVITAVTALLIGIIVYYSLSSIASTL